MTPERVELLRLGAVLEHKWEVLLVIPNDQFVFANRRATELLQTTREEMQSVGYLFRAHPEDALWDEERRKRRLSGLEVPSRYEALALMNKRDVHWLDIGVTMIPSPTPLLP